MNQCDTTPKLFPKILHPQSLPFVPVLHSYDNFLPSWSNRLPNQNFPRQPKSDCKKKRKKKKSFFNLPQFPRGLPAPVDRAYVPALPYIHNHYRYPIGTVTRVTRAVLYRNWPTQPTVDPPFSSSVSYSIVLPCSSPTAQQNSSPRQGDGTQRKFKKWREKRKKEKKSAEKVRGKKNKHAILDRTPRFGSGTLAFWKPHLWRFMRRARVAWEGGDVRWVGTKSGVPREKGGDSAVCFRLSAKV